MAARRSKPGKRTLTTRRETTSRGPAFASTLCRLAGSTARSGAPHRATAVVFAVVFLVAVGAGDATTYDTKGSAYSAAPRARSESAAANLWVGLGGRSACARSATPVKYVAAVAGGNVCDSGPTAYSRAQLGEDR